MPDDAAPKRPRPGLDNLRPWRKGQTGNPTGRRGKAKKTIIELPPGKTVADLILLSAGTTMAALEEIIADKAHPDRFRAAAKLLDKLVPDAVVQEKGDDDGDDRAALDEFRAAVLASVKPDASS